MTHETIRIGIVGAGRNTTTKHIPGLQAIDGVEIISVCNRTRASSQRVADEFGIPQIYDHWRDLVDASDTNAIVIGTWPYLHAPATLAALEAGKHVMCEARMAMNATQARTMLEASRARPHLVTQIVPSPFTLRVDRTVQRLIREGYLGDILALEVSDGGAFVDEDAAMHWRDDRDLNGLNTMSLGIWYESIMRWIGAARRVTAMGKTFVKMRHDPETDRMRAVHVPDHLDVIADMACGAQARFGISNVTGLSGRREAWVFGSEGTLRFADDTLYGGQRGDDQLSEIPIPPEEEGGWRVEEEFVNAIRGREPITYTTFEDGLKYMAFTEAVIRSMMEDRAIPLA